MLNCRYMRIFLSKKKHGDLSNKANYNLIHKKILKDQKSENKKEMLNSQTSIGRTQAEKSTQSQTPRNHLLFKGKYRTKSGRKPFPLSRTWP